MAPTGINRPGSSSRPSGTSKPGSGYTPGGGKFGGYSSPRFSAPKRDDNDRDDGPNIVIKPKPAVPTFKQPPSRSVFAPTTSSQSRMQYYDRLGGGVAPLADIQNLTNRFQRAADIPLFQQRQKNYNQFMQATGGTGNISGSVPFIDGRYVLSMQEPTLTARQPTFGEAAGDFVRGAGNIVNAGLDYITGGGMLGNILRGIGGFFKPGVPGTGTTAPNLFTPSGGGRDNNQSSMMNTQAQEYQNLNATQQSVYNMLIAQGLSHAAALAQAMAQKPATNPYSDLLSKYGTPMARGGIATLN